MTTLLALFRRPDGGPERQATFESRYRAEHLPLVAATPGLRGMRVQRVVSALGGETDLILATSMDFDDRAALDAGLGSDAMRAAGRNLRDIAPGLATLLVLEDAVLEDAVLEDAVLEDAVLEDAPESGAGASPAVDTVGNTTEGPS